MSNEDGQSWAFELPSLGADMDSGTILEWYVAPGDMVKRGDLVVRVETEKSDIDVEIWSPGVVGELLAEVGDQIPVGTPIIQLEGSAKVPATKMPKVAAPHFQNKEFAEVPASPLARASASERNIDLRAVDGSGPGGAVLMRDLKRDGAPTDLATHGAVATQPRPEPPNRMRQAIAERMAKANQEIPHYHLEVDIDLKSALDWLSETNESVTPPERILPVALLVKATAVAASLEPALNGFWTDQQFSEGGGVDVAFAVSLREGGLVTPVVSDADQITLSETMLSLKELVKGARAGALRSRWMTQATITITNLGDNGADRVLGVIFPPQVALVGFGKISERPWVVNGNVEVRPVVTVSLSADHRATDGATGSRFLSALSNALQHPEDL